MRSIMVAGNWKMNGLNADAEHLTQAILDAGLAPASPEVVVFPPFTLLPTVHQLAKGSSLRWGGQNLFWEAHGAYTGEISGPMLRDHGCRYVLVGHSERRQIFQESDEIVLKKVKAALLSGLIPMVCIGETEQERVQGQTEQVLRRQIDAVLPALGSSGQQANMVLAYEPVWAIGTGKTASPEQAQEVHAFVRGLVAAKNPDIARKILILYGGSVKAGNAQVLFSQPDIDGGLVGGASLQAVEFLQICQAAHAVARGI
ncbi:triose-phosphate isomerase [Acidithiobacillus sp. CV18-2]|uniref:Triosephosphate isomerase n=1 Tax=Igneacidithiobacillus copahuensis TaxID=2724909 RepID=A0AAE3CK94_9PROT|nr:triose-phosphate isomerase [Acidithiobacillus sp. CV18-3]MBU2755869.1 triose-phosphate isomerase [Acidithiobacillus sp. BN09-2]MBU2776537.1 triose-phosphate isomerase [Acidithiobacillus sp. CV18-2]MBU2788571.1 triose-phosphate isomerase [Igneacidithiobacillus copahuensis]MBU2796745.1 triose-phosphate isomerase [Acidithiobacillus sp. VAN18-2]MBU2798609.1 triose-phosphate isomerase [Acidithiobacillus sp. VAN18-4]